jgi:hypothetical protein
MLLVEGKKLVKEKSHNKQTDREKNKKGKACYSIKQQI